MILEVLILRGLRMRFADLLILRGMRPAAEGMAV
jgi:hypothetical protein